MWLKRGTLHLLAILTLFVVKEIEAAKVIITIIIVVFVLVIIDSSSFID